MLQSTGSQSQTHLVTEQRQQSLFHFAGQQETNILNQLYASKKFFKRKKDRERDAHKEWDKDHERQTDTHTEIRSEKMRQEERDG